MKGHYKPEDFRREKRRWDWFEFVCGAIALTLIAMAGVSFYYAYLGFTNPPAEPPIPSLSVQEQILGELVRIRIAVETKPEASTNALRTPIPGVAEQLGVSAETKRLVAELQNGGDE